MAGELVRGEVRMFGAVEEEVDLPDGVDRAGRPVAGIATLKRRGTLARQACHQSTTELTVLVVEVGGADLVGDLDDLGGTRAHCVRNLDVREKLISNLDIRE